MEELYDEFFGLPEGSNDLSCSQSFINSLLADPTPMRTSGGPLLPSFPNTAMQMQDDTMSTNAFHMPSKKDSLIGTLAGAQAGGDVSFEFAIDEGSLLEEDEDDDVMIQTAPDSFTPVKELPQGNAFATLPAQMATLGISQNTPYTSNSSGGPRKKRKHVEEEEVSFSLNTEQDPQRLVSTATIPNDLFATELPVSNFSNFSGVQPKLEPLTPFTPPAPQTPQTPIASPGPASTPTFPTLTSAAKPESTASSMLNQVHAMQIQQKEQLLKLHQIQRKLMLQPEMQHFKAVDTEHRQMKAKIEEELGFLQTIYSTHLLDPPELHKHAFLKQDLELQLKQVEIYHRELQSLLQSGSRCVAALVIVKQPFPMIITKNKTLSEEDLEVRLLCGAATDIKGCSKVRASLIMDTHQTKPVAEKLLDCDEQPLDITKQVAKFPLKFLEGSRKNLVTLKFSMQLQVAQGDSATTSTAESEASKHFVVITNEIQWQGSAGTLLKRDAFDGQLEITWPQFANALQRHVLKATKQDPVRPARCLSGYDLRYIKAKFFADRDVMNQKDFDTFWGWFGKNLQMLRYQRHICHLWQQGLIYGFLTRVDVNNALMGQEPGTFLLRFSERHSGQFGIAYVAMEPPHKIKHYLVQKSDTAGAKKTLPDFLGDCPQFRFLLQLTANPTTGEAIFRKLQKDHCLKPFYSKRSPPPSGSGYDPL